MKNTLITILSVLLILSIVAIGFLYTKNQKQAADINELWEQVRMQTLMVSKTGARSDIHILQDAEKFMIDHNYKEARPRLDSLIKYYGKTISSWEAELLLKKCDSLENLSKSNN